MAEFHMDASSGVPLSTPSAPTFVRGDRAAHQVGRRGAAGAGGARGGGASAGNASIVGFGLSGSISYDVVETGALSK